MTNLTARPDAGPTRGPPPAPRTTPAKTPALPAAASSASTLGCSRKGAVSGYGRAGGTIAGRSDRDHRDPRPRDRDGSPRPGRPQARRPRQRDRDIQDRRLPETTAPTTAMLTSTGVHVAFWLADANHPAHTSAPVRTRTNATSNRRTLSFSSDQGRIRAVPARSSWAPARCEFFMTDSVQSRPGMNPGSQIQHRGESGFPPVPAITSPGDIRTARP
jgi:hypothetical protein